MFRQPLGRRHKEDDVRNTATVPAGDSPENRDGGRVRASPTAHPASPQSLVCKKRKEKKRNSSQGIERLLIAAAQRLNGISCGAPICLLLSVCPPQDPTKCMRPHRTAIGRVSSPTPPKSPPYASPRTAKSRGCQEGLSL